MFLLTVECDSILLRQFTSWLLYNIQTAKTQEKDWFLHLSLVYRVCKFFHPPTYLHCNSFEIIKGESLTYSALFYFGLVSKMYLVVFIVYIRQRLQTRDDIRPVHLYLIFEKSYLKNQVEQTEFLNCKNQFLNRFLQATHAVKIQFEIGL